MAIGSKIKVDGEWRDTVPPTSSVGVVQTPNNISIGGTDIQEANADRIGLMTSAQVSALGSKASQSDLAALQGTVGTLSGTVNGLSTSKADVSAVTAVSNLIGNVSNVTGLSGTTIAGKLSNTAIRIGTCESKDIEQDSAITAIQQKNTQQDTAIAGIGITTSGNVATVNGKNANMVNSVAGTVNEDTEGNKTLTITVNGVASSGIPLPKSGLVATNIEPIFIKSVASSTQHYATVCEATGVSIDNYSDIAIPKFTRVSTQSTIYALMINMSDVTGKIAQYTSITPSVVILMVEKSTSDTNKVLTAAFNEGGILYASIIDAGVHNIYVVGWM